MRIKNHPMSIRVWITILSLLLSAASPVWQAAGAAPQPQLPVFEPSACPFDKPAWAVEGQHLDCGYVRVPERHSEPTGPAIRLATVVIKAKTQPARPDPLFMAQGGPGGATIDTYALHLLSDSSFVNDRDIVLFDQRGTGASEPSLYCDEIERLVAETAEQDLTREQEDELTFQAMSGCRQRLGNDEGIELDLYNSLENAADIDDVRQALGYEKINLYGVSYGTLLGLHYVRSFSDSLRSVILDAVVPPQTNFILNSARTMDSSFTRLFETCKSLPECDREYPNLESVFVELVDRLNREPARISLTDSETNTTYPQAVIDGDAFLSGTFQMLYAGSIIPALPRMIYDAQEGNFDFFARIFSLLAFDRSMSLGMYYSVLCAEDADFEPSEFNLEGVRPLIAAVEQDEPEMMLQTCAMWDVQTFDSSVDQPVTSDLPTLLLSGGFDPITPPAYAETVAQTFPRSQHFVFPAGGHGQALEGDCPNGIIRAFLEDPGKPVDASCIEADEVPDFITTANTIDLPFALDLLNGEPEPLREFLLLVGALLFLLTAVLAFPLILLILYLRKRRQPRPSTAVAQPALQDEADRFVAFSGEPGSPRQRGSLLSKAAGWIAFFAGPILLVFVIILGVILFGMAFANDTRIWFGVSASTGPLFVLPLIFVLLTALMLLASLASWLKSYWSIWTRLYFAMLVLCGLACSAVLLKWGVLTALL